MSCKRLKLGWFLKVWPFFGRLFPVLCWLAFFSAIKAPGQDHQVIWQEAESFEIAGGWSNDSQHLDMMGSPYLLATGIGRPVEDAVTTVSIAEQGTYRLWVRCRDWLPSHSPGVFEVKVGDASSEVEFGKSETDDWKWVSGGQFDLKEGEVELRLHDKTGWWGRCDAVVLAKGGFTPSDELSQLGEQRVKYTGVSQRIGDSGKYDVVVVGGGSSGLGAALAAARNGAKVAFIQDRPVLGGNASSEIQVPPMGNIGDPPDVINVSGIAEEIFPIQGWFNFADSEKIEQIVRAEDKIDLHLNTRAYDVEMSNGHRISAVLAVDVRTGQRMRFKAPLFVDTTGHGWIGYYAGAEYRMGTEARSEFGEAMAPVEASRRTMGNSLYKATYIDTGKETKFEAPAWAYQWEQPEDFERLLPRIKEPMRPIVFDQLKRGKGRTAHNRLENSNGLQLGGAYTWYVELGGMQDTIKDAEKIRDELFRIHLGLWDYAKNHDPTTIEYARTRKMAWLNYVPGVRESRRLIGDYIMTQKDFDEQIVHPDTVTFTDWGIDDHHPQGFWATGIDVLHTYHGRRVSIPYSSLYSKNIENLFMAGRCMSASHLALGGTRVQRPMCGTGQAVGTAAAIATRQGVLPRDIRERHITQLQQQLLKDGCYLVGVKNTDPEDLALAAEVSSPEVTNGWNRESRGLPTGAKWSPSEPITLKWKEAQAVSEVHLSINHLRYSADIVIDMETADGWKMVAQKNLTDTESINRRQVFKFPEVNTQRMRIRVARSNRELRLCEVRVYQ